MTLIVGLDPALKLRLLRDILSIFDFDRHIESIFENERCYIKYVV